MRRILRWTWLLPGIAFLLVCGSFTWRWLERSRFEQRHLIEKHLRESRENRTAFENLGGTRFEILHFYATPPSIRRGESTTLCYGVSNASSVKLEPQAGRVWPSPNRCFEISPRRDTTYTLTVENAQGQTKQSSLMVRVP